MHSPQVVDDPYRDRSAHWVGLDDSRQGFRCVRFNETDNIWRVSRRYARRSRYTNIAIFTVLQSTAQQLTTPASTALIRPPVKSYKLASALSNLTASCLSTLLPRHPSQSLLPTLWTSSTSATSSRARICRACSGAFITTARADSTRPSRISSTRLHGPSKTRFSPCHPS
jgi:hypothetical protein